MKEKTTVVILAMSYLALALFPDPTRNVTTKYGEICGQIATVDGEMVSQFLGVPFAKAPVGNLRFEKPASPDTWNGSRDATSYGPSCMQHLSKTDLKLLSNPNISEDCLYLNVFVPGSLNGTDGHPLAVMVYIHGGGYYKKSGSMYNGSRLALNGNVIVVTISYRLSIFGFLSTGDEVVRGNYGLWDQIQALKWVKDNIGAFGGDPTKVTVLGHSAGGYSIGLLLLSTQARGLFARAITMGGSGLSPRAITRDPKWTAVEVAKEAKCPDVNDSQAISGCFRNASSEDLLKAYSSFSKHYHSSPQFIMRFGPSMDNDLIKAMPDDLFKDKDAMQTFMGVDYMSGTAKYDGGLLISYLKTLEAKFNFSVDNGVPTTAFCEGILPAISRDYYHGNKLFTQLVCSRYGDNSSLVQQAQSAAFGYGDMMYESPELSSLRLHAKSPKQTFQFIFSMIPSIAAHSLPSWVNGTYHGEYIPLLFGKYHNNYTGEDKMLSNAFMTYLANFAKYGNPNGEVNRTANNTLPHWPPFEEDTQSYMDFGSSLTSGTQLHRDRMEFWSQNLPSELHPGSHSSAIGARTCLLQTLLLLVVVWTFSAGQHVL